MTLCPRVKIRIIEVLLLDIRIELVTSTCEDLSSLAAIVYASRNVKSIVCCMRWVGVRLVCWYIDLVWTRD
jgi:hypothetical protein